MGRIGADVRVRMLAGAGAVQGEGPGRHRLGLQGFLREGGGHLCRHYGTEIVLQIHFLHGIFPEHPNGPGFFRLGGRDRGRGRVFLQKRLLCGHRRRG